SGRARSDTETSSSESSRASSARRVGSASAAKIRSSATGDRSTIRLSNTARAAASSAEHVRTEPPPQIDAPARRQKHALAGVMQHVWKARRRWGMRLYDLEHEQTVFAYEARIREPAFEVCKTFADQRRSDVLCGNRGQLEPSELVDLGPGRVSDIDHRLRHVG